MASEYDDPRDDDDRDDEERSPSRDIAFAKKRVKTPAVVMLVFAIISSVMAPISAINFFTLPATMEAQRKQIDQNPNMPAADKEKMKEFFTTYEKILMTVLPITIGLNLIVGALSIYGSLKMMNVSSRGWAMTTCILNIVSIGHGCCFLTLPIGIWALVVLMDANVTRGFRAAAAKRNRGDDDGRMADDEG